jgi:Na+/H+-translocating membrane pyrophosphatase
MLASLRKTLVHSHVAAIAIAVLLFVAVDNLFGALAYPVFQATLFIITGIAERELPYIPHHLNGAIYLEYLGSIVGFLHAFVALAGACLISFWSYGENPIRALITLRESLLRNSHA